MLNFIKIPSNDYDIRNGSQYKSNSKANESDYSKQTGIGDQAQFTEQDIQHEPIKSTFDYPNSQVTQPQAENLQPMHEQIEKLESKPLYEPVDQHNDSLDQQSLYVNQLFNHSQSQAVDQQQQQQHLYMQGMNTQRMSPRFSSNNNLFANENQTSEEFNVSQPNQFFNPYQMYQANSFYQPGPALQHHMLMMKITQTSKKLIALATMKHHHLKTLRKGKVIMTMEKMMRMRTIQSVLVLLLQSPNTLTMNNGDVIMRHWQCSNNKS